MRKIVLFEHLSIDGFAAGPDGEMEWIYVDEGIFEVAGQMTDQSDMALYGRVTFELMDSYWPTAADQPGASAHDLQHAAWYKGVPKLVLSRTLKSDRKDITIIGDNVITQIKNLQRQPGKTILMLGSPSAAHSLIRENLIDEYWLFINPVIMGEGKPLFPDLKSRLSLKLVESRGFNGGVVLLRYEKRPMDA